MSKVLMREQIIKSLKSLSNEEKMKIESKLSNHLIHSSVWKDATVIGLTISRAFEWDTTLLIEHAWDNGKVVVVPKCDVKNKELTFYKITSYKKLHKGYANLLEPNSKQAKKYNRLEIDLIVVPGIVFDREGYRIGFGGGYYDRYLEDFNNNTVSLVSDLQLIKKVPRNPYDIPVKYMSTQTNLIRTSYK